MNPPTEMSVSDRIVRRDRHWLRYLAELQEVAAQPQPLQTVGTLLRVTGIVLEAAGVRVPVGAVCEVVCPGQPPGALVLAEVVGFNGDRALLMPMTELHGLSNGAQVIPRPAPPVPPRLGSEHHPWRRSEDRGLHLPMGPGLLGRVIDSHGKPIDRQGPLPTCTTNRWRVAPSIRWTVTPCAHRSTPACAASTRCSPWAAASASACSPARAWARACCWA